MKRGLAVAGVAAVLLLTSCSAGGQEDIVVNGAPVASDAAPLVAETSGAKAATGEAAYLDEVRAELRPDNVIPNATDDQLLDAGQKACEGIAAGADTLTLSLIDGEQADASGIYRDSATIIIAARANLCGS